MKHFILVLFFGCTVFTGIAQLQDFILVNKKVSQYQKAEWNIKLKANWQNPYLQEDIALDMLLTAPSGKKIVLPCFYVSGKPAEISSWKARFTPQENGSYTYNFRLTKTGVPVTFSKNAFVLVTASKKNGFLQAKNNWTLQFDNGKAFRGIGENICWESRASDDSKFFKELHEKPLYDYEYLLPSLQKHGGNFFRTWICSWNLPIDWKKDFNNNRYTNSDEYYNPSALQKFDRLVDLSDSLGLYIMLTLGPGAYEIKNGGFANSTADFFVNPLSAIQYKNRLRYIISRWGYSTAIGAWEFFNEVDNVQFSNRDQPIAASDIVKWHDDMSTYLKATDPYHHLVTTSISHRDLAGLNSLSNIDINQKHIYKNTKIIPATIVSYEQKFNKPYVIGEYGYEYDWQKNFNLFAEEMDSDYKRGLWYGLFSSTPILPMSWWWEFFDERKTDRYLAKVKTISDEMLKAGNGSFEKLDISGSDSLVQVYGVQCGAKLFIYAFNGSGEHKNFTLKFNSNQKIKGYKMYDCSTGNYSALKQIKPINDQVEFNNLQLDGKTDMILTVN